MAFPDLQSQIRQARVQLYYHYATLLAASMCLQHALDTEEADPTFKPFALAKYQTASLALLQCFQDEMFAPRRSKCEPQLVHLSAADVLTESLKDCTDFQFT